MSKEEVKAIVVKKLKEQMGNSTVEITGSEVLMKDLNLASLEIMTTMADLEQELGITVDEEELLEIQTVDDLVDCLYTIMQR